MGIFKEDEPINGGNFSLGEFLKLERAQIAETVNKRGKPKTVAIMLDGTRRVLKLDPGFRDDKWLYYENHITGLIHKSMETVDQLFGMGVNTVIGPLASYGNLHRKNFMPEGLKRLLDPLCDDYSLSVFSKHNASVKFYGDIEYARGMQGGEIINRVTKFFDKFNPTEPSKIVLIGLGFSTDRETLLIAKKAIDFYKEKGIYPSQEDLISSHYGTRVSPIDIFIRTNELKASGGLTPLLIDHDTQFYFPIAPGILSFTEKNLRRILHDYLFNRNLSHGMYEHLPITDLQAEEIKKFYFNSQDQILGLGRRLGDVWIHLPEEE